LCFDKFPFFFVIFFTDFFTDAQSLKVDHTPPVEQQATPPVLQFSGESILSYPEEDQRFNDLYIELE